MKEVKVRKEELLKELMINREKHQKEYKDILKKYRDETIRRLSQAIESFTKDDFCILNFKQRPSNHLPDYDMAIKMAEMSTDEVIELDSGDFRRFVMDEWEWKHTFEMTKTAYGI